MEGIKLTEREYFLQNMKCWNDRVPVHMGSSFYDLDGFLEGHSSLTEIEEQYLGDVFDLSILHLQCHFGMDTLSLSRKGALCTGIDFSKQAIDEAIKLNQRIHQNAKFYESNVYDVLELNLGTFDRIFTSYGTIGWLPDLEKWAHIIAMSLKEKGELYICDFHPALYMFDFKTSQLAYSYFNTGIPYSEEENDTYADRSYNKPMISHFWSHSLDEIISSLMSKDLQLTLFKEFDFSPFDCFPGMNRIADNRYRFGPSEIRIPHLYLIKAIKL